DLARGVDATLVLDGAFTFAPGVVVTTAAQVQGLEFDAVIVPDLGPELYRATPPQQPSLYVAVTRARTWLWLATAHGWSPLLAPGDGVNFDNFEGPQRSKVDKVDTVP